MFRRKVGARFGLFTERHNACPLKKGRKRNEPRGEKHTKKVVIHTMVGKEDGERRRWKGKLGIKGSLRAGSSVLTLSRSVDITDNSRRRPGHYRPTRGSFLFFFATTKKRREVSRKKTWLLVHVCPIFGFYCSTLLSVDVRGDLQWLLT